MNTLVPRMTTINEAAEITGLAKHFIRQLALQGKIRHVRAGKKILINIEKLIEYLNDGDYEPVVFADNKYGIRAVQN